MTLQRTVCLRRTFSRLTRFGPLAASGKSATSLSRSWPRPFGRSSRSSFKKSGSERYGSCELDDEVEPPLPFQHLGDGLAFERGLHEVGDDTRG